jgi:hypothetical protein
MNGSRYATWVANYINRNFGARGIDVYKEVQMGKSIIGKNRRVDVLVLDKAQNKAVAIECKYQHVNGTADEKVPYTLNDAEAMQMDCYVAYGGDGFSVGIKHMLDASELACFAAPEDGDDNNFVRSKTTKELDHILAMRFNWWDVFTANKAPI